MLLTDQGKCYYRGLLANDMMMKQALSVNTLALQFLDKSLPANEFTHHAHLKAAVWHLSQYDVEQSLNRMRSAIKEFNLAHGGKNSKTEGYHETVTRCYLLLANRAMAQINATNDLDHTAQMVIDMIGSRDYLNKFYSKKLLMSSAARVQWHEPDLEPIEIY